MSLSNFENGILRLDDKCDKIDDKALKLINKRSDLKKDDLILSVLVGWRSLFIKRYS